MKFVTVFDNLVPAADEVEVVLLEELLKDAPSKSIRNATRIVSPSGDGRIGIRPENVADQPVLRHLGGSFDVGNLCQVIEIRREAAVPARQSLIGVDTVHLHAEDFLGDDRGDGHAVEAVSKNAPELDRVSSFALVEKSVHSVESGTFVVAA